MTTHEIEAALERIANSNHFLAEADSLVEQLEHCAVRGEAIEPILRFIEDHPEIDYGAPGPLVHFVEAIARADRAAYLSALETSLARRPTDATVWMLNRVINGAGDPSEKRRLIGLMERVVKHPNAD